MDRHADLVVVGAGIVGLAHALAAARRGLSVIVVDRDARANGASVRNFGFLTVTGQQAGPVWERAHRSCRIWAEVAAAAGIPILHRGLAVAVRRPEGQDVLEAFAATAMGEDCELLTPDAARERIPLLRHEGLRAVLWSPHELRVESREAIPALADWLSRAYGVTFLRQTLVTDIDLPTVVTTAGRLAAGAAIVCPGDDFLGLYADRLADLGLQRCVLQMMRIDFSGKRGRDRDRDRDWGGGRDRGRDRSRGLGRVADGSVPRLGAAVMSDPGLVRYPGYADLPPAAALRRVLVRDQPELLEHGVHLIVVQSADGSLVVGDSHHDADPPRPFSLAAVDDLILGEFGRVLELPSWQVTERWLGTYATAPDRLWLVDQPAERVRVVIVTSGNGASTAFGLAEDVIDELC